MFGKKNSNPSRPDSAGEPSPEGQAGYIPIDDAADLGEQIHGAPNRDHELAELRGQIDDANDKWMRALADFQNYQRRALQNEQEARRQGTTSVLHSLIPVLDHSDLALAQKPADSASSGIIEGVKVIRQELIKALEAHGVKLINPALNAEFDPNRHSALTHQPAQGVEPGRISGVFQCGYELHERTVRPAKVAVAPGSV